MSIVEPIRNPALFKLVGLTAPAEFFCMGLQGVERRWLQKLFQMNQKPIS
jgi:hypothetical protein